jgi:SAM-dependent methyltransferase
MEQYRGLSAVYDLLMAGVDYEEWGDYVSALVDRHGGVPVRRALDLACGTGNTTLSLARRGYQVTGLDLSAEMLVVAGEKARQKSLPVAFLQADMRSFALPEPVGLAVAFQDGLNYLLSAADFRRALQCVADALLPGGLFIFDINRVEKLPVSGGQACVEEEEFTLIYTSSFISEAIWEITVVGFIPAGGGLWRRFRETHRERVISGKEVKETLQVCGMTLLGEYAAFAVFPPEETTRRVFYVALKETTGVYLREV